MRSTTPMRALCGALIAVAAVGCGTEKIPFLHLGEKKAKKRVEAVLTGIRDGGTQTGNVLQSAICRWEKDVVFIPDRDAVEGAMDAFDRWRRQGGIYPTLTGFTIADEVEEGSENDPAGTYYVHVTIDSREHWIRVPPKERMSWAD